jgi:tetratricopeptide (TPR) repeat protein
MAIFAGCLVILVIYSNAGNVEKQLSQLSFNEVHYSRSKFAAWRSSTALLEDAPILGVGRGAFEATFTRVHEASGLATYSYLENEYLQAAVDWGIPGALFLGLATLWLAYVAGRRWRDGALVAGVLGALVVVAMQSNVDFGLQFLGLAAPVTVLAATVAYVPIRESERPTLRRGLRVAHALALGIGGIMLLTSLTTTLDEDRRSISGNASLANIRASVTRHPLDYYGYAVAAEVLQRNNDPRAILLLNHAMALHPTHPQLHRMAARMLHSQGRLSQAAVEYAAALHTSPNPRPLIAEIVTKFTAEGAASALPVDYPEPTLVVTALEEIKRADVARMWLARVLELKPKTSRACELIYKLAERGDLDAARIAGLRCADRLPDYQSRISLAKLLVSKQGYAEAIRLLRDVETWQSRRDDKINAWLILCDARRSLGNSDESKRCLRRLDASPDMLENRRGEILQRIEAINTEKPPVGTDTPLTGSAATGSAATP